MARLQDKVAIITGGARGQGAAEARLFAAEGARVIITDLLLNEGQAIAKEIGGVFIAHNVADESQWAEVVRQTLALHGRIDVLINNAGIFRRGNLRTTTLVEYRQVIDVN